MTTLFDSLNESQKQAASHIDGPLLILAGAGSGKTKTITTRLAYLIKEVGIAPQNTLTLTFTNKAASVMRQRALNMIERSDINPLLCTFHKFGLLFLRAHIHRLNRLSDFSVQDSDDVKGILKREIIEDEFDKKIVNKFINAISRLKNQAISALEFKNNIEKYENFFCEDYDFTEKNFKNLITYYEKYTKYLLKYNFVDFDDLLLLTNEILEQDDRFRQFQSSFYQYITVDEYQDTNFLQHKILNNLCLSHDNLCVVGDDDQSIYSWRGAKIENILNFEKEFENVKRITLEQNYRSVGVILDAANELIRNNQKRLGKNLICTQEVGEEIRVYESADERIEGEQLSSNIKNLLNKGVKAGEIAVLFRINALSRNIEKSLLEKQIPYKLLSGIKFYERQEIKDIIAYLRLIVNLDDDYSFKRIINRPLRGFGQTSLNMLELKAFEHNQPLFKSLVNLSNTGYFSVKTDNQIKNFIEGIKFLRGCKNCLEIFENFEEKIGLRAYYKEHLNDEDRLENIDSFYSDLKEQSKEGLNLIEILNNISLLSDQDNMEEKEDNVYLMSIHASKGLEFDYVFIVGLEEGIFPISTLSSDMEEERRLAYVAITRARKQLNFHYSKKRIRNGRIEFDLKKSRFLKESKIIKEEAQKQEDIEFKDKQDKSDDFKKNDLVRHKIFGVGKVISVTEHKKNEIFVSVNFSGKTRILLSTFLAKINE
ncbi:AAA family ATPase [Campylobacter sp. LR291e]|uniref:ATP-dependent helicase n=1 Tax=Campylobacter sp. LR291e TaxID=2593546 RepID=UPI00123AE6EE|nr:UvrD-helicase domain-containing protein [Campylobacter sp. LR291e]KAA6230703.1 AAA family ATPase [Campylobacter sp. LR291e]